MGISLHKQGQVLDHVRVHKKSITEEPPTNRNKDSLSGLKTTSEESERALALQRRKERLQSILNKLSFLVQSRKNLRPLEETIRLQEQTLT